MQDVNMGAVGKPLLGRLVKLIAQLDTRNRGKIIPLRLDHVSLKRPRFDEVGNSPFLAESFDQGMLYFDGGRRRRPVEKGATYF